jgi:hypothetical protein
MKNGYEITWSLEASENLDSIIEYFETNWTEKEINDFFLKLEKRLNIIS